MFCGSHEGNDASYRAAASAVADELVRRDLGLVFGGGRVGLMGVLADRVIERGGSVTGVIPHGLMAREVGHTGVDEMRVVASMHERKSEMARLSGGFIALPGGLGTLEELFEVVTWHQLGIHDKPCGVLDTGGYWRRLLDQIDHAVREGFVREASRDLILVDSDPARLLDRMEEFRSPVVNPWADTPEI